jgi:tRNA threonylcarbamoyladenosine biosynthesis protein TsaB
MRILAFDCAGAQCAAAILTDGDVTAEQRITAERGHAQLLIPMLVELVDGAGLAFGDIDRFAVTTGPGSFTGIRVALAAAHGLALGTGKPIIGITNFEALAAAAVENGLAESRLLVAIDSRRAELFVQLFDRTGAALSEPAMLPPSAVADWAGPGPLTLVGDAAAQLMPSVAGTVDARLGAGAAAVDPTVLARLAAGRATGPAPAPFYLRAPDAVPARTR